MRICHKSVTHVVSWLFASDVWLIYRYTTILHKVSSARGTSITRNWFSRRMLIYPCDLCSFLLLITMESRSIDVTLPRRSSQCIRVTSGCVGGRHRLRMTCSSEEFADLLIEDYITDEVDNKSSVLEVSSARDSDILRPVNNIYLLVSIHFWLRALEYGQSSRPNNSCFGAKDSHIQQA